MYAPNESQKVKLKVELSNVLEWVLNWFLNLWDLRKLSYWLILIQLLSFLIIFIHGIFTFVLTKFIVLYIPNLLGTVESIVSNENEIIQDKWWKSLEKLKSHICFQKIQVLTVKCRVC